MTTLFGCSPGSSAMTFTSVRVSLDDWTCAVEPACASATPSAKLAPTTGIVTPAPTGGASVPTMSPSRVGCVALVEDDDGRGARGLGVRGLDPRTCTSRAGSARCRPRSRRSRPAKSRRLAAARVRTRRHEVDVDRDRPLAVTSPRPLPVNAPVVVRRVDRRELLEHRQRDRRELELVERHVVAGVLEQAGDVVDALRIARRSRRRGAASFASAIAWNAAWCARTPSSVTHASSC